MIVQTISPKQPEDRQNYSILQQSRAARSNEARKAQSRQGRQDKFRRDLLPSALEYHRSQGRRLLGGGKWRTMLCPFHADRRPSLRVCVESGAYKCMACGASGGDVLAFHMQLRSLAFQAAAKELGAWWEQPNAARTQEETPQQAARRLAAKPLRAGYRPESLHAYTDLDGKEIYWRIRLRHPGTREKWIRPMLRTEDGDYRFGEPEFASGKPLYGLGRLRERAGEPVLVCEGESCADALGSAGVVAVTSEAVDSAGKADWQPLAGRDVLIWPDNDEAGQRYAAAVREMLLPLGCRVRTLDAIGLGLAAKEDAVDWLRAYADAKPENILTLPCVSADQPHPEPSGGANEKTAVEQSAAREAQAPDCCCAGGRFVLREHGVEYLVEGEPARRLCGWLRVEAATRDNASQGWGRLLAVRDADGVVHRWAMPAESLVGDGIEVLRELARLGLAVPTGRKDRELMLAYIQFWPTERRARSVDKLGWHGAAYVTPLGAIGDDEEAVVFQGYAAQTGFSQSGSVDQWRAGVGRLARGSTRLVFAVSAAFAGPLGHLTGEDSRGFHLRGPSSSGKTTALIVAASVWGKPARYIRLWRATTNGLEGLAAQHNDGLLILDEISQVDPREVGEAAYLLANGRGKARAARTGEAKQSASWRLLFLSSGEESLAALLARAGKRPNAGQEVRLAEIEADAGRGMGSFEALHGLASPSTLADELRDAASTSYGAVGHVWLEYVVRDRAGLPELLAKGIREFIAEVVPAVHAGRCAGSRGGSAGSPPPGSLPRTTG